MTIKYEIPELNLILEVNKYFILPLVKRVFPNAVPMWHILKELEE